MFVLSFLWDCSAKLRTFFQSTKFFLTFFQKSFQTLKELFPSWDCSAKVQLIFDFTSIFQSFFQKYFQAPLFLTLHTILYSPLPPFFLLSCKLFYLSLSPFFVFILVRACVYLYIIYYIPLSPLPFFQLYPILCLSLPLFMPFLTTLSF